MVIALATYYIYLSYDAIFTIGYPKLILLLYYILQVGIPLTNVSYPYTMQLERLARKSLPVHPPLPEDLRVLTTPIEQSFWQQHLQQHPDQQFAKLILQGLTSGFHIGFSSSAHLISAKTNLISALQHPSIVANYIADELASGRLALVGDLHTASRLHIQLSPLGVIPKKDKPNKYRLIMDLSAPAGNSVNDGISKDDCSFHYASVDDAACRIHHLGTGCLMAKMDICQAYRNIPVAPEDRRVLGMLWQQQVYIDKVLPFGLRSAPIIFSAVADALLWIMHQRGVTWAIHYVDDFLTMGRAESDECQVNMALMHQTCHEAGLPLEPSKTQGPCPILTFLGIELDTISMEMRLPQDKLRNTFDSLIQWRGRKACRKRDLLSLIGNLAHASKVVRHSRIFLRRLIDLSTTARLPMHFYPPICYSKIRYRVVVPVHKTVEWHRHVSIPISHSKQTYH